ALDLDADFGRARQSLAILLADSGRLDLAEAEFRELVTRQPLDPAARLNFATFLFARERYADAERELDRALDLAPDYWRAQLARATLLLATGRGAAARELAARIAGQCPDPRLAAQASRLAEAP
nr:tetratricopeptide repeat protein [Thermoanaerobaculia bacterium]